MTVEREDMETRLTADERSLRAQRRTRDEILTSREAMALIKIGRTKLWELTRDNVIPAYRVGSGKNSALRFKRSDLLAWLERNRV